MDQACLDLSNESDMISEIISFTTDPISMPDATKKKNSKGKNTSKISWESIYKSLKAGDLKDLAELHCGRQVQEKFGHLVKKSLENIYKVQKNPALETTLIETDKVVRQNIARVQSFIKKLEISAPSTSTLDTIETKLTEAQFSHIFSADDDPSTPAPPTPSKQPRCPKVKSESPLEQQGKKLKHLNSRPAR